MRNKRGQSIIEFTLLLPFVLLLLGGAIDLGLAVWTATTVSSATFAGSTGAESYTNVVQDDPRIVSLVKDSLPGINLYAGFVVTNTAPSNPDAKVTVKTSGPYGWSFLRMIGLQNITIERSITVVNGSAFKDFNGCESAGQGGKNPKC